MKRSAAIFLLASPAWVASGVAGWWVGGGRTAPSPHSEIAAAKPIAAAPVHASAPAPRPAEPRHASLRTAPVAPAQPLRPRPQVAMAAATPELKPAPPPRPRPAAPQPAPSPEPVASFGTSDPGEPEKALTPAIATDTGTNRRVLIVVSLASQRAFVFKNGELWGSTTVSTGKKGKRTPVGRYTILEKQVHHRSRTYDNAPMPYMQRLTWGGVALHAGHVTGRPASHGCIRLPRSFAKKLYNLTDFDSTTVVVTEKKAHSPEQAREAA